MITRLALTNYLNNFLSCASFNDYAPNGLQVEGKSSIGRICTAVTASAEVIQIAADLQTDALLVHHGFFWRGEEPCVIGMKRTRIAALLQAEINLLAYHLPLDCHQQLGNNACLAKILDVQAVKKHPVGNTSDLLWSGEWLTPLSVAEFKEKISHSLQRSPLLIEGGTHLIKQIAWCSGAAQDFIEQAHQLGVDAYLSGEISERTYYQAKELKIHYFAAGHHATERLGIQALGEHLALEFNLQHQFIDSNNPV